MQNQKEQRSTAAPTIAGRTITGIAARFNSRSQNLGTPSAPWYEEIAIGAFPDLTKQNCVALFNHDANKILARSKFGKGSLRLWIDSVGLHYQFTAPNTSAGNDLLESIKRGDIDQSSFSFTVETDQWREEGKVRIRTIKKIATLHDISPVAFPAYTDTAVSARSTKGTEHHTITNARHRLALIEKITI